MEKHIVDFINAQTNLTLATSNNNIPYCANCFYVFLEELEALVVKSSEETRHITEAKNNKFIAGTILPDQLKVRKIKGIQFTGQFCVPQNDLLKTAKTNYYLKYPFSLAMNGDLWVILLQEIKMTDNTLGFGKKLFWERSGVDICK